jgi:hypothetical protein
MPGLDDVCQCRKLDLVLRDPYSCPVDVATLLDPRSRGRNVKKKLNFSLCRVCCASLRDRLPLVKQYSPARWDLIRQVGARQVRSGSARSSVAATERSPACRYQGADGPRMRSARHPLRSRKLWSQCRRRHPRIKLEPLTSAETEPLPDQLPAITGTEATLRHTAEVAARRRASRDTLEQRLGVKVPSEDPDYEDEGDAWPSHQPADRDALLQPPKPAIRPATAILQRQADGDIERVW